ncbi:glycoside hydrolase family 10 protein [Stygiobacter electus]|uniref:Family 10 glycosylhydrolase n=1 Tax=Stygiobacter electus TaxID=3032292 RepID=A0AAE3P3H6_9BACT|nr:family 10 glycosylhydrolase [Stygiobacter electus]MDF1612205.1 family 10 glycosylhydrolase [Stygiobacter electus]
MYAKKKVFAFLFLIFTISCSSVQINNNEKQNEQKDIPKAVREFRAAWVATVANINWPSKRNLTTEEQKQEAIFILDKLKENNFNAVIFQARPQCDAFYKSELEPWSYYLTGKQGVAPNPFYDPLQFWIDEAHKRGLELHVWLNPYRAHHTAGGEVSDLSIVKKHPDWVVKLKNGYYWLDPAMQEVQDHSFNVVMDIIKRYDVDGIHFDDYFYPYPSYNNDEDFPDSVSWNKYKMNGGKLSRDNWRRESINKFIEKVYNGIKQIKPTVKFGLSPFGIWRPNHPESVDGFDQYDQLYADAKLWLNKGWVDYWSPQLYWKISTLQQSFPILINWWKNENTFNRHFWPGISIDRTNNELNNVEIINQIMTVRGMLSNSPGSIFWSVGPILANKQLDSMLVNGVYKQEALIPITSWFPKTKLLKPNLTVTKAGDNIKINWSSNDKNIFKWVLYFKYEKKWDYKIFISNINDFELPLYSPYKFYDKDGNEKIKKFKLTKVGISSVDRISNESEINFINIE